MALDQLYQEILLDHYKQPRNKGVLADANVRLELKNPFCGDEILLTLRVDDGVVTDVAFSGHGCVISQASASVMTEKIKGMTVRQVKQMAAQFSDLVKTGHAETVLRDGGDDLEAFSGVCEFPTRVKCAMLAWRTLLQGLEHHEHQHHHLDDKKSHATD